jgi:hypothetical protein
VWDGRIGVVVIKVTVVTASGHKTRCAVKLADGKGYWSDSLPPNRDLDGDGIGDLYDNIVVAPVTGVDTNQKLSVRVEQTPL